MKKVVLACVGLALVALLGGFLWLRSWLTPDRIRGLLQEAVEPHYAGRVDFRDVGLAFPPAVTVEGLTVEDPEGEVRYVEVERVAAHLELWPLLEQRIEVSSFTITRPQVDLRLTSENRPEILLHIKGGEAPAEAPTEDPLEALHVQDIRIVDGWVVVRRPEAEPMEIGPVEARLALEAGDLVVHEATVTALGAVTAEAEGAVRDLVLGPRLDALSLRADLGVPPALLDPSTAGAVESDARLELTLDGPATALTGRGTLSGKRITWQPPDAVLPPLEAGPLSADLVVDGTTARVQGLSLGIWGGAVTGEVVLEAVNPRATLAVQGARVGEWIGPSLLERGLGPPLEELRLTVGSLSATLAGLKLREARLSAGDLRVTGGAGLLRGEGGLTYAEGSSLSGTLGGEDLSSALALPGVVLGGDMKVVMDLTGAPLAPTITGSLAAPTLEVRRPGGLTVPTRDLTGTFRYQDGVATVPDLSVGVFDGRVEGHATLRLAEVPPTYTFTVEALELRLPAAVRQLFSSGALRDGVLGMKLDMQGAGADPMALSATGTATLEELRVTTSGALRMLADKTGMPKLADPRVKAKVKSVRIRDGRLELGAIEGTTGGLGPMEGRWSVGMDQTMDGALEWGVLLDSPKVPELKGKTLPVTLELGGTVSAPEVKLGDVDAALKEMVAREVKRRVEEATGRTGAAAEAKVEETLAESLERLGVTTAAQESLKEKAGGLLKGLFR